MAPALMLSALSQSVTSAGKVPVTIKPATKAAPATTGLQFLGSVSAPAAIEATETGHTNAGPARPEAAARLAEAAGSEPALKARRVEQWLGGAPSGDQWFAIGVWAIAAARHNSAQMEGGAAGRTWRARLDAAARGGAAVCGGTAAEVTPARLARRATGAAPPAERYCAALALGDLALERAAATGPRLAARVEGVRALAAAEAGDPAAAARHYRAGLALDPNRASLHAGLGELARERRDWPTAARELRTAARLDPRDALVAFELGDVDDRRGAPHTALALLDRALRLEPGLLLARWTRARVEVELGARQAALKDYLAAAPVDSTGELQYQLARLYRSLGEATAAAAAERRSERQRQAARGRDPR